jgi:hypothetical protein
MPRFLLESCAFAAYMTAPKSIGAAHVMARLGNGSAAAGALTPGGQDIGKRRHNSRVTNGTGLFPDTITEGRRGWTRRVNDLMSLQIADCGGEDAVSEAERIIIRKNAISAAELEWKERSFALSRSGPSNEDLDLYFRGTNSLRRNLEALGIKRVARDITPTLSDLLREDQAEQRRRLAEEQEGEPP